MKRYSLLLILTIPLFLFSQKPIPDSLLIPFSSCKTGDCKVSTSFKISEYFLETDEIDRAQQWLDSTKLTHYKTIRDTTSIYIHSLQSELFYYFGLFQFGEYEAQKAIDISKSINDSVLISDAYFFKGINLFEMHHIDAAKAALWNSNRFYPNRVQKLHLRTLIKKEHIYNNIAQLYLKIKQLDSAIVYNALAYDLALQENSKRGVPNCEQTFGLIYLSQNQHKKAISSLKQSTVSALRSNYYDIALLNHGFLMQCFQTDTDSLNNYFNKAISLVETYPINRSFQRLFYTSVLPIYERRENQSQLALIREKIITLDDDIRRDGNVHIQNITEQYIANENKLLTLKINDLNSQKKTAFLQIITLSLCLVVLLLLVILFTRKNRIQKRLLHQKNEISKDLHDDIGSGLSSILIHADLLLKNSEANENQQLLLSKITSTGKDISQRMNAFIWSLNTENNNLRNFNEYVKQYGTNLFEGTPIQFQYSQDISEADHISIQGHTRKQLFFCIKELLNNALKHSEAKHVYVELSLKDKKNLSVLIKDDGKGIIKENTFGNGLKNVNKRINDLGGSFLIHSTQGFEIELNIPL